VVPESDDHYSLMDCLELFMIKKFERRSSPPGSDALERVDIVQNYPVWVLTCAPASRIGR